MNDIDEKAKELAEDHVKWFVEILCPLLRDFMIHGFKHGIEYKEE